MTTIRLRLTAHERRVRQHMAAICAWLDANGIPGKDVPIDARPTITGGQIRIETYQRGPGGGMLIAGNIGEDAQLARETVTRPLVVPLPGDLNWWAA